MPIYKREEAKEGGWAQVRKALLKFEATVDSVEDGQWGGQLVDDDGNKVAPREYLEIKCSDMHVLEVSEELTMDVEGMEYAFRENCSMNTGSFWVDKFLASADTHKILLPDGLVGKRVIFKKETLVNKNPKYNSTNYVIDGIAKSTPKVVAKVTTAKTIIAAPAPAVEEATEEAPTDTTDPMDIALELAVGKTETQFRSAFSMKPEFANSPLLGMAKAGLITAALVKDGKLVEVKEGTKTIYRKP
jgi:hypothetical protein